MRRDVQEIFRMTPHEKQVMMFSATLNKEMRVVCKKFMQDVIILYSILFSFSKPSFHFPSQLYQSFSCCKEVYMMVLSLLLHLQLTYSCLNSVSPCLLLLFRT